MTRYISTRGEAPTLGFCDVMLTGLARDGGLYVPEIWPHLSPATIAGFFGRPYWEVAVDVIRPFVGGEISDAELGRMANEAYATFRHPAVVPLRQTGPSQFVLELFHGPTLAFKDVAMQLISRLMDHVLAKRAQRTTIVVATSGDTGGAAVDAFANLEQRRPDRAVSARAHFRCAAADDDDDGRRQCPCARDRRHLRRLPGDREGHVQSSRLSRRGGAVGRQFHQLGADRGPGGLLLHLRGRARRAGAAVDFTVPTGNFGDIFAGYVAKRMGLPVRWLRIAANINDILPRTLKTGIYEVREVHATASPSMDIQVSSNFERLLFEAGHRDAAVVRSADGIAEAVRALRAAGRDAGRDPGRLRRRPRR